MNEWVTIISRVTGVYEPGCKSTGRQVNRDCPLKKGLSMETVLQMPSIPRANDLLPTRSLLGVKSGIVSYSETFLTYSCESAKLTSSTTRDSASVIIRVTYRRVSI